MIIEAWRRPVAGEKIEASRGGRGSSGPSSHALDDDVFNTLLEPRLHFRIRGSISGAGVVVDFAAATRPPRSTSAVQKPSTRARATADRPWST